MIQTGQALGAHSFDTAVLYSENRQFSAADFPYYSGHPFYNGTPQWFMLAITATSVDDPASENPYYVNMTPTQYGQVTLDYNGPWLIRPHLSYKAFATASMYGPWSAPGDWDNQTYTFSLNGASIDWVIPGGALIQMNPPADASASGLEHPVITWSDVDNADAYAVVFYPIDRNNEPETLRPVFHSGMIEDDGSENFSHTYTGDLFTHGIDFAVSVQAEQYHPNPGSGARYNQQVLNRSVYYFKHRGYVADMPLGTAISAQIRSEWNGGERCIHCRVRERKADGNTYRDIDKKNLYYEWRQGLAVPMGIAVVGHSVAFWAEGRGVFCVPLPEGAVVRNDGYARIFTDVETGPTTITATVKNVRIPTQGDMLGFQTVRENQCDVNGDGKIGLEEAVGALQVAAGVD